MRILLIEDDEFLATHLVECLTGQRYGVDAIATGQEGWHYAQETVYDLIIADVGLPELDGISLCQRLRDNGCTTPILLMTAKDALEDRIRGLDAGADDYLSKPFNLDEFLARVRTLLRRKAVAPTPVFERGPLRLDPMRCQVTYAGAPLKLTPKEYSLLELLLRHPERVFSRAQLIEHLWSFDDPPLEDSVKAHIKGLRRKLKRAGASDPIENIYGIGYRLAPEIGPTPAPPSASVEATFQQSITDLWQSSQGLMQQRLAALEQAATAIQGGQLSPEVQQAAQQAAHKLAGVLAMFGCDTGGELAQQLDTYLETNTHLEQVPTLVAALQQQLTPTPSSSSATSTTADAKPEGGLLLVSSDTALVQQLQTLSADILRYWWAETLEQADTLLHQHRPELVVLDIAAASQWTASLQWLQQISGKTPPIATLALIATDCLIDRVAIAQTGLQRLFVKPVSAVQVWEAVYQMHQRHQALTAQILLVDDDPMIATTLRPLLAPWGLRLTALEQPQRFWEVLTATAPDLLILDVEMPQFNGIELCQAVRTAPQWQNLPILFLTAHRETATVQQVYAAGADDYISKPIVGPELLTRVLNRLERNHLLNTLAQRDPLMGLPNYATSARQFSHQLAVAQQTGAAFTLALLQLADLPQLNRRYGPDASHQMLRLWGHCLQSHLGDTDRVGHWGCGDVLIALPHLTKADAADYLMPLGQALRRQIITLASGERLPPTVEMALASHPEDGQTLSQLYQAAMDQLAAR